MDHNVVGLLIKHKSTDPPMLLDTYAPTLNTDNYLLAQHETLGSH